MDDADTGPEKRHEAEFGGADQYLLWRRQLLDDLAFASSAYCSASSTARQTRPVAERTSAVPTYPDLISVLSKDDGAYCSPIHILIWYDIKVFQLVTPLPHLSYHALPTVRYRNPTQYRPNMSAETTLDKIPHSYC